MRGLLFQSQDEEDKIHKMLLSYNPALYFSHQFKYYIQTKHAAFTYPLIISY